MLMQRLASERAAGRVEGKREGLREGKREGLREGIRAACRLLGVPLDEAREAELSEKDGQALRELLAVLEQTHRWPGP